MKHSVPMLALAFVLTACESDRDDNTETIRQTVSRQPLHESKLSPTQESEPNAGKLASIDLAPIWQVVCSQHSICRVEIDGETVVKQEHRGTIECIDDDRTLACLWTHTNGQFQNVWRINLESGRVTPLRLPDWGEGEIVVETRVRDRQIDLLVESENIREWRTLSESR